MTGRLVVKNGKYYVVVSYQDDNGANKQKWVATGFEEKNNKRAAQDAMREILATLKDKNIGEKIKVVTVKEQDSPLFSDYIIDWLKMAKANLEISTYETYLQHVKAIAEYFSQKNVRLADLRPKDIQDYYQWMLNNGKTIQACEHHHVNIRRALQVAYRADLINTNPADKIERPRSPKFTAGFYTLDQIKSLLEAIKGDRFELIYKMTVLYGFRRSEVCGLKWNAVNFDDNTILIRHTVVQTKVDGKLTVIKKDRAKNQSSMRTLPLMPLIKEELLKEKECQRKNRERYKSCYADKDKEYIFVDDLGKLASPQTVSEHFKMLLRIHELPQIRFHDLRHSCASLLLACGVAMKEIQEWLGHSTYSTTADIYSHLNYNSKLNVAGVLSGIFGGEVVGVSALKSKNAIDKIQDIFNSDDSDKKTNHEFDVAGEKENPISTPLIKDEDVIEFKKIKQEMNRLGFDNLDDYLDYLEYMEKKRTKSNEIEME